MLLGCVYIPPENSKYSSEEAFIEVEDELLFFSRDHKNIALAGDFNSRTSNVSDIVELDDNLFDMLDISNVPEYFNVNMLSNYKLAEIGIPLERFSEDKARVNKYGQKLVELCKRCSLYIANGRVYKDKFIGRSTCKDTSLVDYLILSSNLFHILADFEVLPFNPMFSDVHNQIHFSLYFSHNKSNTQDSVNKNNTYAGWNSNKADDFTQVLHNDNSNVVLNELNTLIDNINTDSVTPDQVNGIVNDLGNVLLNAASSTFGQNQRRKKGNSVNNKPWFNGECKVKRDEFHNARKKYASSKTPENKILLNTRAKEYRLVLNANYQKYTEKCSDELRSLSKTNTKAFWKTVHKFSNRKKEDPSVEIETFYDYFKKLNAGDEDVNDHDEININEICDNPIYDEILNGKITELEITEAIRKLKNNKAPGTDNILNEYLKHSSPLLISLYCKVFNLVLDCGIIPESWSSGIIKPVYKNKGNPSDPDNFRAITLISCVGKLFTSILNSRLNFFANDLNIISENQAGFRKGYSTVDNIFVLHALIDLYFSFGKKLYCTFVDFKKAFDTVWRTGLWRKLQNCEIKGKCFKIIYNMYNDIKSCVQYNGSQSDFFPCVTGVRQGENLFLFLFSIFLNDLDDFFRQLDGEPLKIIQEKLENELHIF